jgi:hypothetical protein
MWLTAKLIRDKPRHAIEGLIEPGDGASLPPRAYDFGVANLLTELYYGKEKPAQERKK